MVKETQNINSSSTDAYEHVFPRDGISTAALWTKRLVDDHRSLLKSVILDYESARPLMFVKVLPARNLSPASSDLNQMAMRQYDAIEKDLAYLASSKDEDAVMDVGAIDTAKALVAELKHRQLAPPELSWLSGEAIILLWATAQKKLALTVTDGALGYIMREKGKTVQRQADIAPYNFDLLRLR